MNTDWTKMYEPFDHIARDTLLKYQDKQEPEAPKCVACGVEAEAEWLLLGGVYMCPDCFDAKNE